MWRHVYDLDNDAVHVYEVDYCAAHSFAETTDKEKLNSATTPVRQRATKSIIIFYEIRGNQIHTLPESDVQIHVDARGKRFLHIRVDSDKNLKLGRERFGYVPE